ncbi:MAG: L-asparaginase 1 [Fluviicola sp. XM-24bin1]|nr:MAG: L-asparaginase 1 [Fluviicola sp. XM-24bin1]
MKAKPKVLIVYTGGTIGMIKDPVTGALSNVDFNLISHHVPEINRLNIEIDSVSFPEPVDSSEIHPGHWIEIAKTIDEQYEHYDGFVVLHGSDTMAFTAAALSFIMEGLQKPVILTGSQLPIGVIRTDGKENLITALEIAVATNDEGKPLVTEVAVYFDYKLLRGNRCTKDSAEHFEAFRSPNYPELASAGVHLQYFEDEMYRPSESKFSYLTEVNSRVGLVKLYPGIPFQLYGHIFNRETTDAVVLETFGAGNAPKNKEMYAMLDAFIKDGGIVLNITQCSSGSVEQGLYHTSSEFNKMGVLSGGDMTTEAAITKLMVYVDPKNPSESQQKIMENLRGERSDS